MELYEASRCFLFPTKVLVEKLIVFNCFELGEPRVAGISWQFSYIKTPWYGRFHEICQHQKLLSEFFSNSFAQNDFLFWRTNE